MLNQGNRDTFDIVLRGFTEAARANYGNDSFAAGYLRGLAIQMLDYVPKKHQQMFINDMVRATRDQESEVIQKRNENRVFERV